jgi:DNA-directed RNA polymerase beta' subunit
MKFIKMKKIIIKSILLVLVVTIGGLYYFWQEATKVPDEYTEAVTTNKTSSPELQIKSSEITAKETLDKDKIIRSISQAKTGQKVTVKLNDRDLNNLVVTKLAATQTNKQIPAGIKGINTNIKNGKIYTGALVNLDRLVHDSPPGSQVAALSKLTDKLPFLKNRDIYIGITGKPIVVNSRIEFNRDTQIRVGRMNFTITQLAENLGIAPEKIQHAIDLKLQQQNLKIDRLDLENDLLAIEGAKK